MVTESISCPICTGPAVTSSREGSKFLRVVCAGSCGNEFMIGCTAVRVFATAEGATRRARVANVVATSVAPGKIHVVAWSHSSNDAELSVESRDTWTRPPQEPPTNSPHL